VADDAGLTSWSAPASTSGCRAGHPDVQIPGHDPELGMVPTRSSTVLGAVVLAAVSTAIWVWLPGVRGALVAILVVWLVVTALVQLALGHRGRCALRRTVRWWLGPAGAMLDLWSDGG
jgi:hypothetical protein